jgi:carbon storage regulator
MGERILIGDGVVITVVGIRRHKVRIGIEAPPGLAVDREEIRRYKDQGRAAGGPLPGQTSFLEDAEDRDDR